ncbi:ribbon-helix-helix domain-containing protein [Peribacillus frigoritolerans]|uniref:ribbon-helix-helix domain-containing protein n=1 Tax=Peribacillus frigoritolerans TaxID=450367 RepID=UPI001F4F17FC|nr:ribbon-helix-helix domain-containing protein [Peribacillus frigoritolerans]MCK2020468.1 ribbon-helix-helix domain-containing protein [Peribacillus frigoritolerans]WHY15925.1 ribbon-helix-helix domain-containing protein [Peribacillus frigoritolerans]
MERPINSETRKPINITLNPYLTNRLANLAEERDIPIERLMDKAVDLLLEYMEDNDTVNQVKYSNNEAIEKNNQLIAKSREFINKKQAQNP